MVVSMSFPVSKGSDWFWVLYFLLINGIGKIVGEEGDRGDEDGDKGNKDEDDREEEGEYDDTNFSLSSLFSLSNFSSDEDFPKHL